MRKILNYFREKINVARNTLMDGLNMLQNKDVFIALIIILVAFASFGLGRLSKIEEGKDPIVVEETGRETFAGVAVIAQKQSGKASTEQGKYVASKNGTKYYLPWCGGVDRINEANKVWFETKEEAEARGLQPAANCPGI